MDSAGVGAGLIMFLIFGGGALALALLPYYYLSQIKQSTEQSRNNLRDLNARLDTIDQRLNVVVPKLVAWLNRQEGQATAPPDLAVR